MHQNCTVIHFWNSNGSITFKERHKLHLTLPIGSVHFLCLYSALCIMNIGSPSSSKQAAKLEKRDEPTCSVGWAASVPGRVDRCHCHSIFDLSVICWTLFLSTSNKYIHTASAPQKAFPRGFVREQSYGFGWYCLPASAFGSFEGELFHKVCVFQISHRVFFSDITLPGWQPCKNNQT